MMAFSIDLRAEALLLAAIETAGGDLRVAFAALCSRASLADINGEPFEAALSRAVAELFSRPAIVGGPLRRHAPEDLPA